MTSTSTYTNESAHATLEQLFEYEDTRDLVSLVNDAAELVRMKGEDAFEEFAAPNSRWREDETYIFVLDTEGNMRVHPDPALEGKNQIDLKDINGKPIIRGLIDAALTEPAKPEGWYHYQWPVPDGLLPRWKSSFVQLAKTASGKSYIVGSGMYNDRMEKAFVVDLVNKAVADIEKHGEAAYALLRDPSGPYRVKDTYVFVTSIEAVELVNPAFPNLEGRDLLDLKDTQGKYLNRELLDIVKTDGSGWASYMWPKPGENVSTQKSTYVKKAMLGGTPLMVGCGVYLAEAPTGTKPVTTMEANDLMTLVRQAAAILAEHGEKAYDEFRKKGTKWFRDSTYLFVIKTDGKRAFHATEPGTEGRNDINLTDIVGRPFIKMMIAATEPPAGEGWVHYMYPEPGEVFAGWKSTFVKRVSYPSGEQYVVGCGIYNMKMNKQFIEDVVNRAAILIADKGQQAFDVLRDKTGPFVFMDTYVFVDSVDGVELVNPVFPSLEGKNLMELRDLNGKQAVKDEIAAALEKDSAWLECNWYTPGSNQPARKQTYVRKVQSGKDTYIVGSGIYLV